MTPNAQGSRLASTLRSRSLMFRVLEAAAESGRSGLSPDTTTETRQSLTLSRTVEEYCRSLVFLTLEDFPTRTTLEKNGLGVVPESYLRWCPSMLSVSLETRVGLNCMRRLRWSL